MTGREKVDAAVAYLRERGVKRQTAAPALWRLLWRLGVPVPPPLFLGFVPLTLLVGGLYSLFMAAVGAVTLLAVGAPFRDVTAVAVAFSGALFGGAFAAGYRWRAHRLGLPSWSAFDPAAPDADDAW